jgi:hypothetical protein
MQRKTKIIATDLVGGLIMIVSERELLRSRREHPELFDDDPDTTFLPRDAFFGILSTICFSYLDDHDFAGVRRNRRRRLGFMIGWTALNLRFGPTGPSWSLGIGRALGTICCRFWFGIVRPVPEPRLKYRGFLRRPG